MDVVLRAVLIGMAVVMAGTIPRNVAFAANLRHLSGVPWAVPLVAVYLWFFWRYLEGAGPPESTSQERRESLRAQPVSGRQWAWGLTAGGLGIVALVLALRVANRMVALPPQSLAELAHAPHTTAIALLLMAAPVAGIVEEAAFRGYMQGPIERRYGLLVAIPITGTMFALAHLDFTLVLWPYYVAVAALYGTVTSMTGSILPGGRPTEARFTALNDIVIARGSLARVVRLDVADGSHLEYGCGRIVLDDEWCLRRRCGGDGVGVPCVVGREAEDVRVRTSSSRGPDESRRPFRSRRGASYRVPGPRPPDFVYTSGSHSSM